MKTLIDSKPGHSKVELLTEIDAKMPWASWATPEIVQANLKDISVVVSDNNRDLEFWAGDEKIGRPSFDGLRELSTRVGFPADFVGKLSPAIRTAVINERIQDAKDVRYSFVNDIARDNNGNRINEDNTRFISNIIPGWRGVIAQADVAQTAWNIMSDVYEDSLRIQSLTRTSSSLKMRLLTLFDDEISKNGRAIGDIVEMGTEVNYNTGIDLYTSLFLERLVCLNGMTAAKSEFDWSSKSIGSASQQLQWIMIGLANTIGEFDNVIEKAKIMAETIIPENNDPLKALIERARAMRIPPRFDDRLIKAFNEEPGHTEWHMLNAFTRMATHGGLPLYNTENIMSSAGEWVSNFDMVTARMPRPLASFIGASITED